MAARRTLKHLRTFSGILATTTLFAVMLHGQDFTPAQIKKQPVCSLARTNENCKLMRANRFWWYQQNKSLNQECPPLTPSCWLPLGHQGNCQLV
jgi:hypothetical protein